jgi:hypothetical protein
MGYVVGTTGGLTVKTALKGRSAAHTAPEDFTEGLGRPGLTPPSLYEDQLRRRLGRD